MWKRRIVATIGAVLMASLVLQSACAKTVEKVKVKVLIIPKFEVGNMIGDAPSEAQLFFEQYCAGCEETSIPNATPTARFFVNEKNGVGLLLTGSGKTAAGLSLMSLLSWDAYDFSDAMIVSVGCGGGSTGTSTFGDVVLVTAACDYDLGHRTDSSDLTDVDAELTWFPDSSYDNYSHKRLNSELYERAYELIKDCPLRSTEATKRVLAENFPHEDWAARDPHVFKGTTVSGDSFWKGTMNHKDAQYIAEYYGCPDEYAVTEMEEIAIMNAAGCFGLQDRVISLRVISNLDTFLKGESPEELWRNGSAFNSKVAKANKETVDIFEPAMRNLFDTGRIVVDAILAGEL